MNVVRVSVIIPVYNAQEHLSQCLESVLCQTISDIEIICIDDGSSDLSLKMLYDCQRADRRIRVVEQRNRGGGAARNAGLSLAQGTYLAFLDADDFFEPEMLEKNIAAMESVGADVAVCRALTYDMATGLSRDADWVFRSDHIPAKQPFSVVDMPDYIFNTFANVPWNKVFRRSFVEANKLEFQELKRTNDLLFVCSALVAANKIVAVHESLVNYRIGSVSNCQATNDREPLGFYLAFSELKGFLVRNELFELVERSFENHALDGLVANLDSLNTYEGFSLLYNAFFSDIESRFCIFEHSKDYYENQRQYEVYCDLRRLSKDEFLFASVRRAKEERDRSWKECDVLYREVYKGWEDVEALKVILREAYRERDETVRECSEVKGSVSYRLGRSLTAPYRRLRKALGHKGSD
ncbi:MAG: glycosyltransferase [Gordonibacter sp.]|uniref:glycosyltransferase family 2 protein n=1 Tax=Gordonibacter sp. TaxID=1968902 RepID=UPI002FC93B28